MGRESYFYCHVLIIARRCVKKINTICLDCSKFFFVGISKMLITSLI